jgi:hypothetical protein
MSYHKKYRILETEDCDKVVKEVFDFKKQYYNLANLEKHIAYLADEKPGRYSHAYAISAPEASPILPGIQFEDLIKYPTIAKLTCQMELVLGLKWSSRFLLNVQEYYSSNAAVPKHFDGELLDFEVKDDNLKINKAIRPKEVAVLVLINDVGPVGTRIHYPDGSEEMVICEAGEVVIFDNANCFHSVDAFNATAKRSDNLVRMTLGWRSLNTNTVFYDGKINVDISQASADAITEDWFRRDWPAKWQKIKDDAVKAAF